VITGDGDRLSDPDLPEYVKGSRTRVLAGNGKGVFTNVTDTFMPPVTLGDDWGGKGLFLGDLDGDEWQDDLIITTDRTLSTQSKNVWFEPSTRVLIGSAKGFTRGTGDWLPMVRPDGRGDLHRAVTALIASLPDDATACVFILNAAPVYGYDGEGGDETRLTSLRWFRHAGELPLANVSERQLPNPEIVGDYYVGHAMALGDLDGDGTDELVITTEDESYLKEGKRPTRVLKLK
jgi:hypothetical protein